MHLSQMNGHSFMAVARESFAAAYEGGKRGESPLRSGPDAVRGEPKQAAVTVLFTLHESRPSILMIRRSATGGQHRTEWAFPGGIVEPSDSSLGNAALRETEEELGIGADAVEIWGPMPSVITGTGYEVWPFVGELMQHANLVPSASEVDGVAYIPIEDLADKSNRRNITLVRGDGEREWDAIACDGRVIWGASARIIDRAMSILMTDDEVSD